MKLESTKVVSGPLSYVERNQIVWVTNDNIPLVYKVSKELHE